MPEHLARAAAGKDPPRYLELDELEALTKGGVHYCFPVHRTWLMLRLPSLDSYVHIDPENILAIEPTRGGCCILLRQHNEVKVSLTAYEVASLLRELVRVRDDQQRAQSGLWSDAVRKARRAR